MLEYYRKVLSQEYRKATRMTIVTQAAGRQWVVASESKPGTLYIVRKVGDTFSCDCAAGFYRNTCKHALAVAAAQPHAFRVNPELGLSLIMSQPK